MFQIFLLFLISMMFSFDLRAQAVDPIDPPEVLNPTYYKVMKQVEGEYKNALERQAREVTSLPDGVSFNGQGIGLSWQQNYSSFSVRINRTLAPNLFDDKSWIVNDEVEIELNLMYFLKELSNDNPNLKLPAGGNLNAFAGVKLTRLFRFMHSSPSFKAGLFQNLDRLLVPFQVLLLGKTENLRAGEYVERVDYLGVQAAGALHIPVYGPFSFGLAVNGQYGMLSHVVFTKSALANNQSGEVLDVQFEQGKITDIGLGINLQMDLLKFIKTNIFEVDFSYRYEKSAKATVSVDSAVLSNPEIINSLKKVAHGKWTEIEDEVLAAYIVSNESKEKQISSFKMSFLLFESKTQSATQSVQMITKEGVKNYFHHEYTKNLNINDPLTWLFGGFIGSIASGIAKIKDPYQENKKITIEYQYDKNLVDKKENFFGEEKSLSAHFENHFKLGMKFPLINGAFKKKILARVKGLTSLPQSIVSKIMNDELRPPFNLSSYYEISDKGIYLMNLKNDIEINQVVLGVCKNSTWPMRLFNGCQLLKKRFHYYWMDLTHNVVTSKLISECKSSVDSRYPKYNPFLILIRNKMRKACIESGSYRLVSERNNKIPLWRMKSFFDSYFVMLRNRNSLYELLGEGGLFIHGSISAQTKDKRTFLSHFKEGAFVGLGVIESAARGTSSIGEIGTQDFDASEELSEIYEDKMSSSDDSL